MQAKARRPIRLPCWRRCAGPTSRSCTSATTVSNTTPIFRGLIPTKASCAIARDEFLDADGGVSNVRYRLTLLEPACEGRFESDVLLSRAASCRRPPTASAFIVSTSSLPARFSSRRTAGVGASCSAAVEFYLNLDRIEQPDLGYFIEVKFLNWSRRDAEHKAELARELVTCLGVTPADAVAEDYVHIVGGSF